MPSITDLRSDTVTRPTPGMLDAMMRAKVGDDEYGEDPTVSALQAKVAALFGKEAALFCPSATMTNQIAVKIHTRPGDEVICHELAHIYLYEGGGMAGNSGASARLLKGDNGRFTAEQVEANINPDKVVYPATRLVAIENTVNRGGGCCWDLAEIRRIRKVCAKHRLAFHLDGARIFNALVARGESPKAYGLLFDTVSVCFSKGLGAPVGSLLLGSKEHMHLAARTRKTLGGGMRQAGFLAAAGIYALDHNVKRLKHDHAKAAAAAKALGSLPFVSSVLPAETNIVIFQLAPDVEEKRFLGYLKDRSVLIATMGSNILRLVFHLDVSDLQFERFLKVLRGYKP